MSADVAVPASPERSDVCSLPTWATTIGSPRAHHLRRRRTEGRLVLMRRPRRVAARSFRFRYPSGPTDAEALAVRPNGDLTIVSKGRSGTIDFFSIPADTVASACVRRDRHGAVQRRHRDSTRREDRSPGDGRCRVARRHDAGGPDLLRGVLLRARERAWRESLADLRRPCALGDAEPQGEAIDYLDANTLLLTSERSRGRPGSIHRLQC